ncbi:MAG TPA: hypothetical protein VIY48_11775 [Candidatus Paceibacterota bacterium]
MTPKYTWDVHYWIERRWLRWRVCANYWLMPTEDSGHPSYCIGLELPSRHWTKRMAKAEMLVHELVAQYGEPELKRITPSS